MSLKSALLCAAILSGAAFVAAPAFAADWNVGCLADHTPAQNSTAATAKAALALCGVTPGETAQAQRALSAYITGQRALATLEAEHGVSRRQVLDAWAAIPAADKRAFLAIAPTMSSDPAKVAVFDALVDKLGKRLNLPAAAKGPLRQVAYSLGLLQAAGRGTIAR